VQPTVDCKVLKYLIEKIYSLFIVTTFGARSLLTRTGEQIHNPINESVKKAKIGNL
jgi:hypothetical protein